MSLKKTILFIDHDKKATGSTISLIYLVKYFVKKDYSVFVLSPKEGDYINYIENTGAEFIKMKWKFNIHTHFTNVHSLLRPKGLVIFYVFWVRLIKGIIYSFFIYKKINPNIVYINEHTLFQFGITSKLLGIPTFTHLRSPMLKGTFGLRKTIITCVLKFFNNNVFAITSVESNQLNISNVLIINEFLDEYNFKENNLSQIKIKYNIPSDQKILLILGAYEPIKGNLIALKALKNLLINKEKIFLIIVGKANKKNLVCRRYFEKCQKIINIYNLDNNFLTIPYTNNPVELISISDIVLSPLTKSHFSRPIIESWAQRKGVISSNTDHAKYYIEDRVDGLLFEIGKVDDLTQKIMELLHNQKLYDTIRKNGYNKARKLFSIDLNCGKIFQNCDNQLNLK